MKRIILEDIRINKKPRVIPRKEEVGFVEIESINISIKEKNIETRPSIFLKNKTRDKKKNTKNPTNK
ncbi:MAG: hypothetical protein JJE53_00620 [Candidatus Pacebacteria bacterium]|nr:hypothetical protein [Candidatus Paceibacterota bacterium]